jgi:hypothetical protein
MAIEMHRQHHQDGHDPIALALALCCDRLVPEDGFDDLTWHDTLPGIEGGRVTAFGFVCEWA